jgi:glycosyltransferase involved in cell wall biosynthesis
MHVLMVCLAPPYPPHDGMRLRTWNLLVPMARHLDVTVLAWTDAGESDEHVDHVRRVAPVVVLPKSGVDLGRGARLRRQARFLFGGPPPFVQQGIEERALDRAGGRRHLAETVRALHQQRPIDIVVFEDEEAFSLPFPDIGVPVAVHKLNVFARVLSDMRRTRWLHRAAWPLERPGWRRFDRNAVRGAALVIATTPETGHELTRIAPGRPVVVVTSGINLRERARHGGDIAFIGRMDLDVNIDAVTWFAGELWPQIHCRLPGCRFRIVGAHPSPSIRALASAAVEVTGEVPDLVAACQGVGAGVVPLRGGMGIKTKTLDLMAMGIPVVATRWGAEGIDVDQAGLIVADDPMGFVQAVTDLLAEPDRARRLGDRGRTYVEQHHSCNAQAQRLQAALTMTSEHGRVSG